MAKLVIVESPAKAKTIGKYLGDDYEVTASMGHIRDLPASQLGIDVEHGYTPQYISIKGKEKLIKELKSKAKHADGVLLAETSVTFSPGESVFDVLQRVCRENRIHMESSWTPMYNSAYIEGIYNLYEFDVGDGSGWMYKVNDWFPNYGCSRYQVQPGDVICWVYTCDLGYDVGGGFMGG